MKVFGEMVCKKLSTEEIKHLDEVAKKYGEEHSWRNDNSHIEDEHGGWYTLLSEVASYDARSVPDTWILLEISGKKSIGHVGLYYPEITKEIQSRTQAMLSK